MNRIRKDGIILCMFLLSVLLLCGCAASGLTISGDKTLYNAEQPEEIGTYDGSGQATHPSVVYFDTPWHGYSYWMVLTPYPYNNDKFENPAIVVSVDGEHWKVPEGVDNPLVDTPQVGHNCDVDLIYVPEKDELWLYFVEADDIECSYVKRMTSSDGVHWSRPEVVLKENIKYSILSPAIVRLQESSYQMWYVDSGEDGYISQKNRVMLRASSDGVNWGAAQECTDLIQPGYQIWHMEVLYIPETDRYVAIYPAYPNGGNADDCELFFAEKEGEGPWQVREIPILRPAKEGAWDDRCVYRTTFLIRDNTMTLWYSARKREDSSWRIGKITTRYTYGK